VILIWCSVQFTIHWPTTTTKSSLAFPHVRRNRNLCLSLKAISGTFLQWDSYGENINTTSFVEFFVSLNDKTLAFSTTHIPLTPIEEWEIILVKERFMRRNQLEHACFCLLLKCYVILWESIVYWKCCYLELFACNRLTRWKQNQITQADVK